jgi:hypothetical protein
MIQNNSDHHHHYHDTDTTPPRSSVEDSTTNTDHHNHNNNNNIEELIRFRHAFGGRHFTTTTTTTMSATIVNTTTNITISDLSDDAQRHYNTFQRWKQQHAKYLYHPMVTTATTAGHTFDHEKNRSSTQQPQPQPNEEEAMTYNDLDALEWYNAYQYSIQYHLLMKNEEPSDDTEMDHNKNRNTKPLHHAAAEAVEVANNNNNDDDVSLSSHTSISQPPTALSQSFIPFHNQHFRIILAPHHPSASINDTTAMMTRPRRVVAPSTTTTTKPTSNDVPSSSSSQSRILYVLPAGMNLSSLPPSINDQIHPTKRKTTKKDITKLLMEVYTTAFAVYIYRTLFVRHPTNTNSTDTMVTPPPNITLLLDVRPGSSDWPNIPAIQFLSYIRYVSKILPYYFPNICTQILLYPIPSIACTLYNFCIRPVLDQKLQHLIQLVTSSSSSSSSSSTNQHTTTTTGTTVMMESSKDQNDHHDSNNNNNDTTSTHDKSLTSTPIPPSPKEETDGSSSSNSGSGLYQYLSHDNIQYLESLRYQIIHHQW